jgi:peptidoglycan hydrolase CwlO-like protein
MKDIEDIINIMRSNTEKLKKLNQTLKDINNKLLVANEKIKHTKERLDAINSSLKKPKSDKVLN